MCRSLRYPGEKGQLDVHAGPEPGAQVGGAGEDVAQALVPHELPATLLDELLHLGDVTSKMHVQHLYSLCSTDKGQDPHLTM